MAEQFDPDWTVHPGATIKDWCDENKVKQSELAQRVGISAVYMHQIITGKRTFSTRVCLKIAEVTGMPPRFLWNLQSNWLIDLALGKTWMH